jgi:adhesin transport system membrane fusion protein
MVALKNLEPDHRLLLALSALMTCLLVWAVFCPVDQIVRAEGRIIPTGRAQTIQHLEGGIVSQILVREGQMVQAGDVLMRLSDVQANTSVQQGQSRLHVLKAQQARLTAEAMGQATPEFEADIPADIQQEALSAFRERISRFQSERQVLSQQHAQRQAELSEAASRTQSVQAELDLARKQSNLMDGLYRKGAASQMELLDAQSRTQKLNTAENDILASIPRLKAAIAELSAKLAESTARFRAEARTELTQVSAEVAKMNLAVDGDSDRLSRTEVRAPTSGFINRLNVNTIGGVVKPGEAILEITPTEGPVAVEARVRPNDRASLRAGLETRVLIGAYDYAVYGALQGRLIEVSADTVPDETGQRYYRVLIQTDKPEGRMATKAILPGMTARADVVLGQRTVLSYLLSPLLRFKQQAFTEPT